MIYKEIFSICKFFPQAIQLRPGFVLLQLLSDFFIAQIKDVFVKISDNNSSGRF